MVRKGLVKDALRVCLITHKGRVGRFWGLDGLLNPCFDEIEGWLGPL